MRTFLLAATAAALLAAAPAFAAEGNGPSFPGYRAVSTAVTTDLATLGAPKQVTTVLLPSGRAYYEQGQALPSHRGGRSRVWGMIDTVSGLGAG